MKPGLSLVTTGSRPRRSAIARAAATMSSRVSMPGTTSTRRITPGGLKKCMPTTSPGRCVAAAMAVTERVEVFVAKIASGATTAARANSSRFSSRSSGAASNSHCASAAA